MTSNACNNSPGYYSVDMCTLFLKNVFISNLLLLLNIPGNLLLAKIFYQTETIYLMRLVDSTIDSVPKFGIILQHSDEEIGSETIESGGWLI